jgi:hypothetical protein
LSASWKSLSSYYMEQARSGLTLLLRTADLGSKKKHRRHHGGSAELGLEQPAGIYDFLESRGQVGLVMVGVL